MSRYRKKLPQLEERLYITDGGIETTLIFNEKLDLPHFAAFDLLKNAEGTRALEKYFLTYVDIARRYGTGLILESATWRSSADWGRKLGYGEAELAKANRKAIEMLLNIRDQHASAGTEMVVSGCVGPRGDGYVPTDAMSVKEARKYHAAQIETFRDAGADMVAAITMNYAEEAVGVAQAAKAAGMPAAISFTVETDGNLPTGQTLADAIKTVERETDASPAYYMINCAHPEHFATVLGKRQSWTDRIRGVRANASRKSHAELNESTELDPGNPEELARDYRGLKERLKNLNVLGGCCGTDHRHLEAVCKLLI